MGQKLKLAFFADILVEDFDGASRTITHILKRIPSDKYEVLLICGVPPQKRSHWPFFKVPVVTIPFNADYSMAIPQFVWNDLKDKLSDFDPDVIHISTPSMLGEFALSYGKKRNIPAITIYHTHFISYIDYYLARIKFLVPPVKKLVISGQRKFYSQCDKVYIPTHSMKKELEGMGFYSDNFRIWPRGLDTGLFTPEKRNQEFIRSLTNNGNKNILFASRLVWEKNLKTLIEIYHICKQRGLPYNFIIAGDGVAKEELKRKMPDALFLGHMDHDALAVLYASCDLFLFTSISETFGNVVIEAQASGLPVVIADGGGSAGLIDHGVNGFLCPPTNANKYIEYIISIFTNDLLKLFMIQNGLQSIGQYQWANLMNTYLHDLQTLKHKKEQENIQVFPLPVEFAI